MKRIFTTALVALAAVFGIVAISGPATAVAPVAVTSQAVASQKLTIQGMADGSLVNKATGVPLSADHYAGSHTPWLANSAGTPYRFNSQFICAQNNIGTLWNISAATGAFESGVNTYVINYRFPAWGDNPCSNAYSDSQIIMYGTFQANNSVCYEVYTSATNGRYNQHVTVAMNASAYSQPSCRSSSQQLNMNISNATGNALALANFYNATGWQASIMNSDNEDIYNFAGGDDRTSLCKLLKICS